MTDSEQTLIVASRRDVPVFSLNATALAAKADALSVSALIGRVTDRDSKIFAVRAQQDLKRVIAGFERERKLLKEPLLNAGRQLDNLIATESLELEKEFGRVSQAVKEFDDAERRRVLEEERLQRAELERIERAKQADLQRLVEEQARADCAAREAQARADALAREVKDTASRAAAKAALQESERLRQASLELAKQSAAVEEKAGDAAYCAAKPIEITRVVGQRVSTNWVIVVHSPYVLAKFHPDLVEIKPRLAAIKEALNEGREVKGITATRETTAGVRVPTAAKAIEV